MKKVASLSFGLFLAALILFFFVSCDRNLLSGSRLTPANYDQGKESVTIVFKDDKVQSKVSTLSE